VLALPSQVCQAARYVLVRGRRDERLARLRVGRADRQHAVVPGELGRQVVPCRDRVVISRSSRAGCRSELRPPVTAAYTHNVSGDSVDHSNYLLGMGTAVECAAVPIGGEPESAWLLPTIARLLVAAVYLLFCVSIGLAWPLEAVANGFQLLGLLLAALGVPVVPPELGKIERALSGARVRLTGWFDDRREALLVWTPVACASELVSPQPTIPHENESMAQRAVSRRLSALRGGLR
jgi:hypothetical protein